MRNLFRLCVGVIGYVYVGYPALLWLMARFRQRPVRRRDITPNVTIAIAAYNGEKTIAGRIENCLALDYPPDRLELLIGSDGSTDRTVEIVSGYASRGVRLLQLERQGKALTDNVLVEAATGEIVVTSSAAGRFPADFLKKLVRNFADPEVGVVIGVFRASNPNVSSTSANENAYWRYEMWMRQKESDLGILSIGSGVCMGFRKELYEPLLAHSDADHVVPKHSLVAGKRIVFEPEAVAYDEAISSPRQEFQNRVRQVTRGQRDTLRFPKLLNPLSHAGSALSLWSHKLLRWWTPLFAIGALLANLFLLRHFFYRLTLILHMLFYVAAFAGYVMERRNRAPRLLTLPMNFCLFNLASFVGTLNVLRGKRIQMWEPRDSDTEA